VKKNLVVIEQKDSDKSFVHNNTLYQKFAFTFNKIHFAVIVCYYHTAM